MTVSLNTQLTGYGVRLTLPASGAFAGDINRTKDAGDVRWRFVAPEGDRGPLRRNMAAAEYDALAHWSDQPELIPPRIYNVRGDRIIEDGQPRI